MIGRGTVGILLLVSTSALGGCMSMLAPQYATATYDVALVEVERPTATRERWGDRTQIELGDSSRYHYEDDLIDARMAFTENQILFILRNKTDHSVKLIWDEAAYIDYDGALTKVMHEGTKYVDRNAAQPPSIIPARQSLTDLIAPNNRVYYREGYYGRYYSNPGGWEHAPLILPYQKAISPGPSSGPSPVIAALRQEAEGMVGKRVGVLLPLEIEGVTNEYTFWFEIKSAHVTGPGMVQ